MTVEAPTAGTRTRRRRWPWVLAVIGVAIVAIVVAAELIARSLVPGIVAEKLRAALSLPADHPVQVEVDGWALPQVIAQRLDHVTASSDAVTLGTLTADISGAADGVTFDGGMESARISADISAEQILALVSEAGVPLEDVTFGDDVVTGSTTLTVFGQRIPISLTLVPAVTDGDLQLTAESADIGGITLTADGVRERFGNLANGVIGPWPVCLRGQLPMGVHLTTVTVSPDGLVGTADLDGRIALDPALQAMGTCD
ncbi:LmeA family phospholipid-binding protein [Microbacterium gorillae]|uniref:LmeA family phospholipid-binding protein n=1 Tax=Microbacterium gorillae TaxID=1231063 RepID=UPI003D96CAEB